ncbi:head GIN domain-containing protein [Aequorivita sp. CIP111184]|uniref:head GIN domain-containing protein n=1 Tax=Aequorivita sp. CIP111184 TaxID=2211356 RepID=UPI000DBBDB27|nr:head GIN domain-containing protein [Aequorivita sp. CIP111184]SRX55819.1 hypothetical protein AEQU1_02844 [Aequorivita sp. CIP111184]
MARLTKFSFALMFLIIGNLQVDAQNRNNNSIKGSGNIITKTLNTQSYNAINVSGSMDVYLEKGTEGNISITAEDNVQDKIVVESDGTTLTISMKNNTSLRNTEKIKITVPFEDISEISLRGSGNVEGKDILKNNTLTLNLQGSGGIKISIDATSLDAKLNGSGDMKLSGKATDVEVKTTGSGNFEGKELISENAQIYISGSGDSTIFAKNSLKARIQGSGSIFCAGNPSSNDVKVMGSGKVKSI